MKKLKKKYFIIILTFLVFNLFADDTETIPPEILKQMNKEILEGKRPTIHQLRQGEIFSLRENPKFQTDFVTFDFDIEKISSVQMEILENWIRSGNNKIYLEDLQILKYISLFKPVISDFVYKEANKRLRHPVNTDVKDVLFSTWKLHGNIYDKRFSYEFLNNLPIHASIIVEGAGEAVCGSFRLNQGEVYFLNTVKGRDARRWLLNYWHWAMGFKVLGAADTNIDNDDQIFRGEGKK
jgi:hypothetical protein